MILGALRPLVYSSVMLDDAMKEEAAGKTDVPIKGTPAP
jgi:hypothetical protein